MIKKFNLLIIFGIALLILSGCKTIREGFENPKKNSYEAIIIAVPHNEFFNMGISSIKALGKKNHVLFDLKSMFDKNQSDIRL